MKTTSHKKWIDGMTRMAMIILAILALTAMAAIAQTTNGSSGCVAKFITPTLIETGKEVAFKNASSFPPSNYTKWTWSFGDGSSSDKMSPGHIYDSTGSYIVCLSLYDSLNNCASTYCDTVEVKAGTGTTGCKAAYEFGPVAGSPYKYEFVNKSSGNYDEWYWSFGDGSAIVKGGNPVAHEFPKAGTYTVCLKLMVSGKICDYNCKTVTVGGNTTKCIDQNVIDKNKACMTLYAPVCGCNGITYENECVAYYHHGVTQWTQGACTPNQPKCEAGFIPGFDPNGGLTVNFKDASAGSPTSWKWGFGDGTYSTDQHPSHTYSKAGTYNVCLLITSISLNGDTCKDDVCKTITVGNTTQNCLAKFKAEVDSNGTLYLINLSEGSPTSFAWDFGDGNKSTDKTPKHQYAKPGTYTVCLTVSTPGSNCYHQFCQTVTYGGGNTNPFCKAAFKFNITASGAVEFWNASTGPYTQVSWDFGDNTTSSDLNPKHTYNSPGVYEVCLSISNMGPACGDKFCQKVIIGNPYKCEAYFSYKADPSGNTVWFANYSAGNATTYSWDFGDGNSSTDQMPVHTYSKPGTYQVCLTISNPNANCYDKKCMSVTVGQNVLPCTTDFSFVVGTNGLDVAFKDESKDAVSWEWFFGDGSSSTDQNPAHTFAKPGTYSVCLKIVTNNGCIAKECHNVKVGSNGTITCSANFFASVDSVSNGVYFNNVSAGGSAYLWDFGDGNTSKDKNPYHTYANAGTYMVCLTVYEPNSNCFDTECKVVVIGASNSGCNSSFISMNDASANAPYNNGITYFYDMSTGNPVSWFWDFGDGNTSTEQNPKHQYAKPGDYTVCLTIVTANQSCTSSGCQSTPVFMVADPNSIAENNSNGNTLGNYPNPFNGQTTIAYTIGIRSQVSVDVYDMIGNHVAKVYNGTQNAGNYQYNWNASGLANGMYILKLTVNEKMITRKMIISE